jgi:O-acetyl-ADP-ribose deacetylase (regulator of RNase III)
VAEPTRRQIGRGVLELVRGDITHEATDAVVNAANSSLLGGGGVDGAIHRAGGSQILVVRRAAPPPRGGATLPAGQAVITGAGRLPCRFVIHAVGPVWHGGDRGEPETLAACYRACLALAERQGLESLAFPSISTGAYGYPIGQAAPLALSVVADALARAAVLRLARFVLFSEADLAVYTAALAALPTREAG